MAYDFHHTCQVETRKILWLIGLVLGSILIIQYFELPYRDRMLSLLSSGKDYFNFSGANRGVDGDIGYRGRPSDHKNNSSPSMPKSEEGSISKENLLLKNTMEMNHTAEGEKMVTSISIAPEKASDTSDRFSKENVVAGFSPSLGEITRIDAIPPAPDEASDAHYKVLTGNVAAGISPSISVIENTTGLMSGENARIAASPKSFDVSLASVVSPSESISPRNRDIVLGAPVAPYSHLITPNENGTSWNGSNEKLKSADDPSDEHSSVSNSPPPKSEKSVESAVSISEMNNMLLHSRVSSFSKIPLWPSAADQELLDARFQIEHADIIRDHPGLYAPIYRNLSTFVRSYEIMEQKLKIHIYKDGRRPVFHQPRLKGIYASEGWFMKHLEASNKFVTSNPGEAHLFYLPFSSQLLVDFVYVPNSHTFHDIIKFLENYLDTIKVRYSFWNRTDGADHFLVACHDWAAFETRRLMTNCIRALCNADLKEGFQFGKDISLPETYVRSPQNPLTEIGGSPPSKRKILAFFAGQMHGYVRPLLLKHWENKDPDMKIFGRMRKGYVWHMKNSKYCICAKGYEVNSPRVVEAIIYGCVPVIISDNFVPPFFDILNWDSFAVFVPEKDIPNLKNILVSIPQKRYVVMQQRVKQVRQHFLWHNTPVKYDIFHMILHSIWYNRVFRLSPN